MCVFGPWEETRVSILHQVSVGGPLRWFLGQMWPAGSVYISYIVDEEKNINWCCLDCLELERFAACALRMSHRCNGSVWAKPGHNKVCKWTSRSRLGVCVCLNSAVALFSSVILFMSSFHNLRKVILPLQTVEGNCRQDVSTFIAQRENVGTVYSKGEFGDIVPLQGTNLWLTDHNWAVLLSTVGSEHSGSRINDRPTTRQYWHIVDLAHFKPPSSVLREIQPEGAGGDWLRQYFETYLRVQSSTADNIHEHQIALTADGPAACCDVRPSSDANRPNWI